jgi:hypothetical protein
LFGGVIVTFDQIIDLRVLFVHWLGYHDPMTNISFNLIVGVLAIAYGLYCFYQRKTAPESIEKLTLMIERNGEKMGHSIHLFGYTILPIVTGLLLMYAHFKN